MLKLKTINFIINVFQYNLDSVCKNVYILLNSKNIINKTVKYNTPDLRKKQIYKKKRKKQYLKIIKNIYFHKNIIVI